MTAAFKTTLPMTQKFVFVALCDNANDQGECYPSIQTLVEKCSLSERAVRNALRFLEVSGFLVADFRTGRATIYHVAEVTKWPLTPAPDAPLPRHHVPPGTTCPPAPRAPHPGTTCPPTPAPRAPGGAPRAPITIIQPSEEPSGNQKQARGTRLPADWTLTDVHRTAAKEIKPDWPTGHVEQVAATFRDYWISQPGAKGVKLDWLATWRNWCRNDRGPSRGVGGKPSRHDLRGIDYNAGVNADGSF